MRPRQIWTGWPLATGVALCALVAQADPLKDPKRVVDGQSVSLAPLFEWWTTQQGSRPLRAWVQVTGEIVSTSVWSWTVDAQIRGGPATAETNALSRPAVRIILKRPPQQDRAEFDKLVARRQAINQERERLAQVIENSVRAATNVARLYNRDHPWKMQSRTALDDAAAAKATESQAREQVKELDGQLAIIARRLQAYPDANRYIVDCLALDTGTKENGVPVYEYGLVMR